MLPTTQEYSSWVGGGDDADNEKEIFATVCNSSSTYSPHTHTIVLRGRFVVKNCCGDLDKDTTAGSQIHFSKEDET